MKLSKKNEEVITRLSSSMKTKQSLLRDRHGNRTNLIEVADDKFLNKLEKLKDKH